VKVNGVDRLALGIVRLAGALRAVQPATYDGYLRDSRRGADDDAEGVGGWQL